MIIEVILLILALPVGYLIAGLTRDELVDGRKWFYLITIVSMILAGCFAYKGLWHITLALLFMAVVSIVSIIKSKDRKWVKG